MPETGTPAIYSREDNWVFGEARCGVSDAGTSRADFEFPQAYPGFGYQVESCFGSANGNMGSDVGFGIPLQRQQLAKTSGA